MTAILRYIILGICFTYTKSCETPLTENTNKKDSTCVKRLKYKDDDVIMDDYQMPLNFDVDQVVHNITDGPGYYIFKNMWSKIDIEMAKEKILYNTNPYVRNNKTKLKDQEEIHNNYDGMIWRLMNKGKIFEKLVQHPAILQVSDKILGKQSLLGSFAGNTVLPGMKGQEPHLDYPYYQPLWPDFDGAMKSKSLLALQFVTMLTDFTPDNGGTAIREYSHIEPKYPYDKQEFFANMRQVEGKSGDMVVFAGPIQHCSMPNKAKHFRSGLLQQMLPAYILPFEDLSTVKERLKDTESANLRRILGLDHKYPVKRN